MEAAGEKYNIIVRKPAMERLREKNFRGTAIVCAGNFSKWPNIQSFLYDEKIKKTIMEEMLEEMTMRGAGTSSFELEFEDYVGWSSTDNLQKYSTNELELHYPNRRSTVLRVKMDLLSIRASKTKIVTLVYELKREGGILVAVIHSIYPGHDIGELYGDVSEREKVVFFDWNHPGEK